MGHLSTADCKDCGQNFSVEQGGGFRFHVLRCDTCGETKHVSFEEMGELHLRYLKGLPGPYSVPTKEHDDHVRKTAQVKPISEAAYNIGVEKFAGRCECGGKFTFDAPPRCPKCHSTNIKEGQVEVYID